MTVEIRSARASEMAEFRAVADTANVLPPGIFPPETMEMLTPQMTLGAFVDGRVATSYAVWPLEMRINGNAVPVAGISGVGTRPVYRRQGFLRRVITRHFELMHEREVQSVAVLYASRAAIYQRYGYAVVSTRRSYHAAPGDLILADDGALNPSGTLRQWEVGTDIEPLQKVYDQFIAERNGYLERTNFLWRCGVLADPLPGAILQIVIYEEQNQPQGYLIYTVEPCVDSGGQLGQKMVIRDFAWLMPSAYIGLIRFLSRMDLVHDIIWPRVAEDDPLPHLLLEPRKLSPSAGDGILARIVDVAHALAQRRYVRHVRDDRGVELILAVRDPLCPWNDGSWHLRVVQAAAEVSPSTRTPQLAMSINTLAMLYFGQISAIQAARMGRLEVIADAALESCDRIFQTRYKPFCADIF